MALLKKNRFLFPRYNSLGASSRVRFFNFYSFLPPNYFAGVFPLFSNAYLRFKYDGHPIYALLGLYCFIKRFFIILYIKIRFKRSLFIIEKELFPYVPFLFESLLLKNQDYILDFDDAIFHNYDIGFRLKRLFLSDKIKKLSKNSISIIAGNSYLVRKFILFGANDVCLIPSCIFLPVASSAKKAVFRIVWIGTPSTICYLDMLENVFQKLGTKINFELVIIGSQKSYSGFNVINFEWSEDIERSVIPTCSIGIMPLSASPWERGKCGYKLLQYMSYSVPVIASPIGVNKEFVKNFENGLLASSDSDWYDSILWFANLSIESYSYMQGRSFEFAKRFSYSNWASEFIIKTS